MTPWKLIKQQSQINTTMLTRLIILLLLCLVLLFLLLPYPHDLIWKKEKDTLPLNGAVRYPDFDNVFPGNGPMNKESWFLETWAERRKIFFANQDKDRGAVVFFGDSITEFWKNLESDFPGLKIANRGIAGDCTRGLLYRLQNDVMNLDPAAIVMLIGINDINMGANPVIISENIGLLLTNIKKVKPKLPVIVCYVMPSGGHAEDVRRLNSLIDRLITGDKQFILCDTWSIFANKNGTCRINEFPDLLHPNAMGYAKWAAALKPIFSKLDLCRVQGQNLTLQ